MNSLEERPSGRAGAVGAFGAGVVVVGYGGVDGGGGGCGSGDGGSRALCWWRGWQIAVMVVASAVPGDAQGKGSQSISFEQLTPPPLTYRLCCLAHPFIIA